MKKTLISLACVVTLTACGSFQVPGMGTVKIPEVDPRAVMKDGDTHELKMFKEKVLAAQALKAEPLLKITAIKGQTMSFTGVESIVVNAPGDTTYLTNLFARDKKTWEVIADYGLRALEVTINPLVSIKLGKENAITQRKQIDATLATHQVTYGTLQGIATGAYNAPVYTPVAPSDKPLYTAVAPSASPLYTAVAPSETPLRGVEPTPAPAK